MNSDKSFVKDKRLLKNSQHIDIFINDSKFKVLSCKLNNDSGILRIKTKIRGQKFPCDGIVAVSLPYNESTTMLSAKYHCMYNDSKVETWEYILLTDED